MDEGLDGGLVEVAEVGGALPRLLAQHECLRVDEAEGVDDNFALDGLDRVDDDGDGAGRELLEGLLRIDVDGGEPAAEAGVGVVPAYYCFWPVLHRLGKVVSDRFREYGPGNPSSTTRCRNQDVPSCLP